MIDEAASGILQIIARFIFEIVIEIVLYSIGYYFVKGITFGKYPTHQYTASNSSYWLNFLGFIILLSPLIGYVTYAYMKSGFDSWKCHLTTIQTGS